MGRIESRWRSSLSRRAALRNLAGFAAGSPLLLGQQDPFRDSSRIPGMKELVTTFDFEPVAYAKLPRDAYDYTAHGDRSEFTLRRNREAFDWVELVPKTMVDVSSVQTATEVLGVKLAFPMMVSPTAYQIQLHPEGEIAMRQGALAAAETPMIVSNNASFSIDKIAASSKKGTLWFQLYPQADLESSREIVENAQSAGCKAIVMTVDQQAAVYDRSMRNRNLGINPAGGPSGTPRPRRGGTPNPYRINTSRLWLDWGFIAKIRPFIKVPFMAKGIVTGEDAKMGVEHGLDAIYVSNHGGRSLDYGPSTMEVLTEVVDVVNGRVPVIVDSGFRRGSDVLKALALGAKCVALGRVPRWGLAAYGPAGVQRVLEIMQSELLLAMANTGRPTLDAIDRTLVRTDFP